MSQTAAGCRLGVRVLGESSSGEFKFKVTSLSLELPAEELADKKRGHAAGSGVQDGERTE